MAGNVIDVTPCFQQAELIPIVGEPTFVSIQTIKLELVTNFILVPSAWTCRHCPWCNSLQCYIMNQCPISALHANDSGCISSCLYQANNKASSCGFQVQDGVVVLLSLSSLLYPWSRLRVHWFTFPASPLCQRHQWCSHYHCEPSSQCHQWVPSLDNGQCSANLP